MAEPSDFHEQLSRNQIHTDWSCLVGQSYRLRDRSFRAEVLAYAVQMMARANDCLQRIIERLHSDGYRFAQPHAVTVRPETDVLDRIEELEDREIHLPLSLQAWLAVVGQINLMGSHPDWLKPGYVFDDMEPTNDVLYADPLVVEATVDNIVAMHAEWQSNCEEEGIEECGPFRIEIGPDYIHKANVSGGCPYQVSGDSPCVDSILFYERQCTTFVNYIRLSLGWGGFPGFVYMDNDRARNTMVEGDTRSPI